MALTLNERALRLADFMATNAAANRISVAKTASGTRIIDCGVNVTGGLQAGLGLARVCLAGQAEVSLAPGEAAGVAAPFVHVAADNPVLACLASQYAGWQVTINDKFIGMGSGPMRAAWGKEVLFQEIPGREQSPVAVGVLETGKLPADDVASYLARELNLAPEKLTLLAAPAASIAGTLQVVARSLETAIHKLHELKFPLEQITSGWGTAPMPPIGKDDLQAIGRTNDAILYGGRAVLWVNSDDTLLGQIGPKVPSNASNDYGKPFSAIFEQYGMDFYKIDRLLFSPAEIVFHNLRTGKSQAFGEVNSEIMKQSFFGS